LNAPCADLGLARPNAVPLPCVPGTRVGGQRLRQRTFQRRNTASVAAALKWGTS
jgi:hypothetical protein